MNARRGITHTGLAQFVAQISAPLLAATLAAPPALAHHVVDGRTPATLTEGLLSGLGHPIIGVDHLVFVLAIGVAMAFRAAGGRLGAVFIGTLLAGLAAHLWNASLPLAEVLVAGSVVAAGAALVAGPFRRLDVWPWIAGAAGLVHGYALGEPIIGASAVVVASYALGLAVSLAGLLVVMSGLLRLITTAPMPRLAVQTAGGAVLVAGLLFLAGALMQA